MRSHKGLSTVVGAVFLVAAVVSSLSYVSYSMNSMGDFSRILITEQALQTEKLKESFEVSSVTVTPANKLDAVIRNSGQIPLEIKTLWIDEQNVIDEVKKFVIDKTIAPGGSIHLIDNVDFDADPNKGYNVKIVTGRGDVQTFYVNSPASNNLYIQTLTLPETVSTEFDTVILMSVTNNSTNASTILNLTPTQYPIIDTSGCTICTATYVSGPTPSSYPSLKPGETAIFKWVYTIAGSHADKIKFTTSLQNGVITNTASSEVKIREVVSSLESGTSISALGLQTSTGSANVLYLHSETFGTPSNAYQLATTTPDTVGNFIDIENENPSWFTNNGTNTITIPAGTWTASLNYLTEYLPDNLIQTGNNEVDMIFHFNDNSNNEPDSAAKTSGLTRCNGSARPTYFASGGPDNSSYYRFDGNDCMTSTSSVSPGISDIAGFPDTTAIWFRADNISSLRAIMFRADRSHTGYSDDFYQISLGDGSSGNQGKLVFQFTTGTSGTTTKCMSSARWDNNIWHHVVAVRDAANQCKLYVDGNSTPVATHTASNSNVLVDTTGSFKVGYNGSSEYFIGDIAQMMHWNEKALSTSEISSLYASKYGDTATLVDINIHKTDVNGSIIGPPIHTITNHPIRFGDSKNLDNASTYNNLADSVWKHTNYTASINQVTINPQERLKFTITYKSGLDMILRHDDLTMTNPKSSFLQIPTPISSFGAYFSYSKSAPLKVITYNGGPYGSWFLYQGTRAVFNNLSDNTAYAGIICSVNSTQSDPCSTGSGNNNWMVSEHRDSIFVPVGAKAIMYFWEIQDRPDRNQAGGSIIPNGDYHLYIFISGYDEVGKTFLRQMDIGRVRVTS
jgi:hypothetical protein